MVIVKFKGQSVQQIEWKQTDKQTDEQTDAIDCFTFPANEIGSQSVTPRRRD